MTNWMRPTLVQASGFTGRFKLHFKDAEDNRTTIELTHDDAKSLLVSLQERMSRWNYANGRSSFMPPLLGIVRRTRESQTENPTMRKLISAIALALSLSAFAADQPTVNINTANAESHSRRPAWRWTQEGSRHHRLQGSQRPV